MKKDQTNMAVTPPSTNKKAYRSPELVVYGDVRQMTHTVGVNGNTDGVGGPGSKSNP